MGRLRSWAALILLWRQMLGRPFAAAFTTEFWFTPCLLARAPSRRTLGERHVAFIKALHIFTSRRQTRTFFVRRLFPCPLQTTRMMCRVEAKSISEHCMFMPWLILWALCIAYEDW